VLSQVTLIPSRRAVWWCDVAAAVAALVFAALGAVTGAYVAGLAEIHRALLEGAHALDQAAQGVGLLGQVPFVGDDAGRLAAGIGDTAAEVRTSATTVRADLRALGVLIGIVIVAIPVVPLVLLYAPLRLARRRELRQLRRMLDGPAEPALVEHLARAAAHHIPCPELHQVSAQPWRDIARGHHSHLAAAELRRLGILPPAWIGSAAGPPRE
jgi:hypothetical protein